MSDRTRSDSSRRADPDDPAVVAAINLFDENSRRRLVRPRSPRKYVGSQSRSSCPRRTLGLPAAYWAAIRINDTSVGDGPCGIRWSELVKCVRHFRYSQRPHRCHVHLHPLAVAGKKPSCLLSRSVSQATAPGSPTRELLQRRKLDGDGGMEALRVLKRRLSDVVYRAMLTDQNQSLSAVA